MPISRHIDIAGYLHIGYGVLILLGAVICFVVIVGGGLLSGDAEAIGITAGVGTAIAVFLAILALPSLIGGYGLIRRRPWSRVLVIVLSVLHLFSFPIGTAVGGYSLWVLFQDKAQREFA
jgi:hypothetical protein